MKNSIKKIETLTPEDLEEAIIVIKDEKVPRTEWLGRYWCAFKEVTVLQGASGVGKSELVYKCAADLSKGVRPPLIRSRKVVGESSGFSEWQRNSFYYQMEMYKKYQLEQEDDDIDNVAVIEQDSFITDEELEAEEEEIEVVIPPMDHYQNRVLGDPIKTVYISRENSKEKVMQRYYGYGGKEGYFVYLDTRKINISLNYECVNLILKHAGARFLVIDPILLFVGWELFDNIEMENIVIELTRAAKDNNAAILILNNTKKENSSSISDASKGYGAGALVNATRMALHAGKFGPFTYVTTIKNNLKSSTTHVAFLADQKGRIDYISYDKLKNAFEKELKKDPEEKAYLIDRTQKTMVEIIKNEGPMTKEDWLKRTREEMDTSVATMQRVLERLGGLLESSRNSSKKKIFWWKGE